MTKNKGPKRLGLISTKMKRQNAQERKGSFSRENYVGRLGRPRIRVNRQANNGSIWFAFGLFILIVVVLVLANFKGWGF